VPPSKPLKDNLRKRSAADLSDERHALGGWVRQPETRWLDPSILARAGVEVAVSGTFGKFADKREIQTQEQGPFDYSTGGELWVDYLSDTGDGWAATQTMAWVLAQPSLPFDKSELPRGSVLLLGGDQVYPTASAEAYEDRFKGPFAAALPRSEAGSEPDMYATPGNHDWYDGLVSFLRLFCQGSWIGGWRTRQRRSYFALQLPNRWWILAIDIQLDTYIDDVQLQYFADLKIGAGDKVVLLTAKPSWVAAVDGRAEPPTWKYLSFFEERMVRDTGARLVLTITGDRHHYARYEPTGEGADEAPTRITAGGGGAYLSATHTLPEQLELAPIPPSVDDARPQRPTVVNRREEIYPVDADSRRLSNGILKLAALNPAFGRLMGVFYALIGASLLSGTPNASGLAGAASGWTAYAPLSLYTATGQQGYFDFVSGATGAMSVVLALVLFGGLFGGADIKQSRVARVIVALAQTLIHLLAASLTIWAAVRLVPHVWDAKFPVWAVGLAAVFVVGQLFGTTVFAFFLWLVHKVRGPLAQANANQVFTGQSIMDYKNLLRMRLGADGGLTIYPLGVDTACRKWTLVDDKHGPRFEPRSEAPAVHPIDHPLRYDPAGNRIT
jgi:hypothetical protein